MSIYAIASKAVLFPDRLRHHAHHRHPAAAARGWWSRRVLTDPKTPAASLQPSPDPHRRDPECQPGRIVGLDRDAAQRGRAQRRLETAKRECR